MSIAHAPPVTTAVTAVGSRRQRRVLGTVLITGCLAAVLVGLSAPAVAQSGTDTTAPTLADGTRSNVTTMAVTVADDTDVDEPSIDADDFVVSDGELAGVSVDESGSNATVLLSLAERSRVDDVTVSFADGGTITDAAGNELANGSVTVTGMDSYVPQLERFAVEPLNQTHGRVVVSPTEPLVGIDVSVTGPANATLNRSSFQRYDDGDFYYAYATTYRFPERGEYRFVLDSVTDRGGNRVNYSRADTYVRDSSPPEAVLDGPAHLTVGDRGRFDASGSTDAIGIAGYNWSVDGNRTANGSVFEHEFTASGPHTVGLTVVDRRGNRVSTNASVTVHEGQPRRGVNVTRLNRSRVRATVGPNRSVERVRVADAYGRLVSERRVTLRSVTLGPPENETASLNVSANADAPAFETATGNAALARFTVDHGNRSVDGPTFRFAVSASRLTEAGVFYGDVALYRETGDWTALDTGIVRATASTVVYEATAPGLSTFVVGTTSETDGTGGEYPASQPGPAAPRPAVSVTSATLLTETVDFGEYAVVEASVTNGGTATRTDVVGLTVGSDVVATKPVTVPAGDSRTVQFAARATENATVAVNGSVAGTLVVDASASQGTATDEADGAGALSGIPIPNPLALWPGGLLGAVLSWVATLSVVTYAVLKGLAIYLGY